MPNDTLRPEPPAWPQEDTLSAERKCFEKERGLALRLGGMALFTFQWAAVYFRLKKNERIIWFDSDIRSADIWKVL